MPLSFRTKRRVTHCEHTSEVRLEIAGLIRSVCESCGRVTVEYVTDHFRPERVQELGSSIDLDGTDPDAG